MTRRAYEYFVLTFVLGAVVGAAAMFLYTWRTGHWRRNFDREHIVRHLKEELSLTDPQVVQVRQILDDSSKKFEEIQRSLDPQLKALHLDTRTRIRQILNPNQAAKFDEMIRKMEQREPRHRGPEPR